MPCRAGIVVVLVAMLGALGLSPVRAAAPGPDPVLGYGQARRWLTACEARTPGDPLAACLNERMLVRFYESIPVAVEADTAAIRQELGQTSNADEAARLRLALIRNLHVRRQHQAVRREVRLFDESGAAAGLRAPHRAEIRLLDAKARLAEGEAAAVLATLDAGALEGEQDSAVIRGMKSQLRGVAELALGDYPKAAASLRQARSFFSTSEVGRLYLPEVMAELVGALAPISPLQATTMLMEIGTYIIGERTRLSGQPALSAMNISYFTPAIIRALHHLLDWTDADMEQTLASFFSDWTCGRRDGQIDGYQFRRLGDVDSYAFNLVKGRAALREGRNDDARRCLQWALHFANAAGAGSGLQVAPLIELARLRLNEPGTVLRSELDNLARAAHVYGDNILPRSNSAMIVLHGLDWAVASLRPGREPFAYRASEQILLGLVERKQFVEGPSRIEPMAINMVVAAWNAAHAERRAE